VVRGYCVDLFGVLLVAECLSFALEVKQIDIEIHTTEHFFMIGAVVLPSLSCVTLVIDLAC